MPLLRKVFDSTRLFAATHLSPLSRPTDELASTELPWPRVCSLSDPLGIRPAEICRLPLEQYRLLTVQTTHFAIPGIAAPTTIANLCLAGTPPLFETACLCQHPQMGRARLLTAAPTVADATPHFELLPVWEAPLALAPAALERVDTGLATCQEDLTAWLNAFIGIPEICSLFHVLLKPTVRGKDYSRRPPSEQLQDHLDFGAEGESRCRHGMVKKSWCARCREERGPGKSTSRVPILDLFDLLWPLLQAPPGELLDNRLWFPEGCGLFTFQRKGVKFLVEHPRALLGDEMGLGKAIQAIVAARILFRTGRLSTALVVCPKTLLPDWERKLWDWAPELRTLRVAGNADFRKQAWEAAIPVRIVNYETLRQDIELVRETDLDLCILDEGQYIKNATSLVSKACKQIGCSYRWVLSGTPLENKLDDLVSLFGFLQPGLLLDTDAYRPQYLKARIAPYILRRRKSQHAEELKLPDKRSDVRWLDLLPRQREAYDLAEKHGIVQLEGQGESVTVHHVLALITKLKQLCNFDPASEESCKQEFLVEQLDELHEQSPEEKVLIFSQYPKKSLTHLCGALARWSPLTFEGELSSRQRDAVLEQFERDPRCKVLLLSLKAGGLGLSLDRASRVYHYDQWWNPASASQAEDRTHRIGQKRTVFVTSFLVKDTIEERIHAILQRKKRLFGNFVDDLTDQQLQSKLTEEELFGLFGLEPPRRRTAGAVGRAGAQQTGALDGLSPGQFERAVAHLYSRMGYMTRMTPPSKDGGVDIYARKLSDASRENLIIQCKHYPRGTVGVAEARALNGLLTQDFTGGVLATSGRFSEECRQFCARTRIGLVDGEELVRLLEKYGVGPQE